jgi:hypothetical protein
MIVSESPLVYLSIADAAFRDDVAQLRNQWQF